MAIVASEFVKHLVRVPSVTPDVAACLDVLQAQLHALGFACQRMVFADTDTPDVDNLYATIGTGGAGAAGDKHLMFAGHVDVVPPGDVTQWTHDPFSAHQDGDTIYGRGTTDMKGGIAAFVSAVSQTDVSALNGRISLLITGDEEGPAINGTVKMVSALSKRGEKWHACITGEPTNTNSLADMIKVGRRGSLTGKLTVHGTQGHVGYPHLAKNAIHTLTTVLYGLQNLQLDNGNAYFDASSLQVVDISTPHPAPNLIPAAAHATFNVRFSSEYTGDTLEYYVRDFFDKVLYAYEYDLDISVSAESFLTEPTKGGIAHIVADAVEKHTGTRPVYGTTGGTSDSRFITNYCDVVDYGATGKTMHAINECTSAKELDKLSHIYATVIKNFFGL